MQSPVQHGGGCARSPWGPGAVGGYASGGWAGVLLEAEGVPAVRGLTRVQRHDWAGHTGYRHSLGGPSSRPDGCPTPTDVLPAAVRQIVSDLRAMLEAGRVEDLKRVLSRLVASIEVHEDPRPGRKRPGAVLVLQGSLEAALQLASEEVKGAGRPGGILAPLIFELPHRRIRLLGRYHGSSSVPDEQRRAVIGA